MKRFLIFIFTCFSIFSYSQVFNPVEWGFESKIISNHSFELIFNADIKKGWNLYSRDNPIEVPVATTFNYNSDENNHFNIYDGAAAEEGDLIIKDDPIFFQVLKYYYDNVTFRQVIDIPLTVLNSTYDFKDTLNGQISFMTCDSTSCIAEYIDFSFEIIYEKGSLKSVNYIAQENKEVFTEIRGENAAEQEDSRRSIFVIFILGFLGGLAALLTPCVFPMIPLTVSYFTKKKSKGHIDDFMY